MHQRWHSCPVTVKHPLQVTWQCCSQAQLLPPICEASLLLGHVHKASKRDEVQLCTLIKCCYPVSVLQILLYLSLQGRDLLKGLYRQREHTGETPGRWRGHESGWQNSESIVGCRSGSALLSGETLAACHQPSSPSSLLPSLYQLYFWLCMCE